MLYINRIVCFLLAGVLLNVPCFATVSSVSTAVGASTYPSVNTDTGAVRPTQMRYCCASWVDYFAMVIVTNAGAGYFLNSSGGPSNLQQMPLATAYSSGITYGNKEGFTGANVRPFGSMTVLKSTADGSTDGHWLSCPAGYMAIGRVYRYGASNNTKEAVYCAPIRYNCQWISRPASGTGSAGIPYPYDTTYGTFRHFYPTPENLTGANSLIPVTANSAPYYDDYRPNDLGLYNDCQ